MKEKERKFLIARIDDLLEEASRFPVHCGAKLRLLESLEDLAEKVSAGSLEDEPPREKPMSDQAFEMLVGLRGLSPRGSKAGKGLEKAIRRQRFLRRER